VGKASPGAEAAIFGYGRFGYSNRM